MAMVAVCALAVSDIVLVVVHARLHLVLETICQALPVHLAAQCSLIKEVCVSVVLLVF